LNLAIDFIPRTEREINPFVGTRPFTRSTDDRALFFGRDRETDELVSLILRHKLTLVYAMSGAGKTSIFNAQVIPTLENFGCTVLPIGRIGLNPNVDQLHKANFYLENLVGSLRPDQSLLEVKSLSEFLNVYFPTIRDKRGKVIPQILIIDQLEELFGLYIDSWPKQRNEFFQEVADALNCKDNYFLRIVLILREDYLAQLDPFLDILPERLGARFRLERLKKDGALLAIKGPLESTTDIFHNADRSEIGGRCLDFYFAYPQVADVLIPDTSGY
jgi:hypothetical protein